MKLAFFFLKKIIFIFIFKDSAWFVDTWNLEGGGVCVCVGLFIHRVFLLCYFSVLIFFFYSQ